LGALKPFEINLGSTSVTTAALGMLKVSTTLGGIMVFHRRFEVQSIWSQMIEYPSYWFEYLRPALRHFLFGITWILAASPAFATEDFKSRLKNFEARIVPFASDPRPGFNCNLILFTNNGEVHVTSIPQILALNKKLAKYLTRPTKRFKRSDLNGVIRCPTEQDIKLVLETEIRKSVDPERGSYWANWWVFNENVPVVEAVNGDFFKTSTAPATGGGYWDLVTFKACGKNGLEAVETIEMRTQYRCKFANSRMSIVQTCVLSREPNKGCGMTVQIIGDHETEASKVQYSMQFQLPNRSRMDSTKVGTADYQYIQKMADFIRTILEG
jgi:hypothetical protein